VNSAIYEGTILHQRSRPMHRFQYRICMFYLDLAELDAALAKSRLFGRGRLMPGRFRREDYLGPEELPLDEAVRRLVNDRLGFRPEGPVRLLTHLRYFGHCFNPVSFYYCFDQTGEAVQAIVAEINNTPWNERYAYVLAPASANSGLEFHLSKAFHVSPFMPMDLRYRWRFSHPADALNVQMENLRGEDLCFMASLSLKRRELSAASMRRALWRYPLMTVQVVAAIYWQAFRLWRKGTPFYAHPKKSSPQAMDGRPGSVDAFTGRGERDTTSKGATS